MACGLGYVALVDFGLSERRDRERHDRYIPVSCEIKRCLRYDAERKGWKQVFGIAECNPTDRLFDIKYFYDDLTEVDASEESLYSCRLAADHLNRGMVAPDRALAAVSELSLRGARYRELVEVKALEIRLAELEQTTEERLARYAEEARKQTEYTVLIAASSA